MLAIPSPVIAAPRADLLGVLLREHPRFCQPIAEGGGRGTSGRLDVHGWGGQLFNTIAFVESGTLCDRLQGGCPW